MSVCVTVTLDGTGHATVSYPYAFSQRPIVSFGYTELANGQPVTVKRESDITNGSGQFVGCVIMGYRLSLLPALLASLFGFNVASGNAAGVSVDVTVDMTT